LRYCEQNQLKFIQESEVSTTEGIPRLNPNQVINYKTYPKKYTNKLAELRYSANTEKVYIPLFEEFINRFQKEDLDTLTEKHVVEFSRFLMTEHKVSAPHDSYRGRILLSMRSNFILKKF